VSVKKEALVSSFFGNEYVTLLDVEIADYICTHQTCSRRKFIDVFCQQGYSAEDVTQQLDRQCSRSTLRFIPSKKMYEKVDTGTHLWADICSRIHSQESVIAGQLQAVGPYIRLDVYRSDFQSPPLKKVATQNRLKYAPVMKWTGKFRPNTVSKCVDRFVETMPCITCHDEGDRAAVLHCVKEIINKKPKRAPWAWLIIHPVVQLELTPPTRDVLETLFSLSNGPVDWKGIPISLSELKINTDLSTGEIEDALQYLEEQGIVRQIGGDFTPTGQGYTLVRQFLRPTTAVTFAVTHSTDQKYQLEISTPSFLAADIQTLLLEHGGRIFSTFQTPAVFPLGEKDQVLQVLQAIINELSVE